MNRRSEQFEAWACRFPSLRAAPGVAPWDPALLDRWASGNGIDPAARHAVRFLLWNWGGTWQVGTFDALAAMVWWDAHHREIFLYWLTASQKLEEQQAEPPWTGDDERGAHLVDGHLLGREVTDGASLELCTDSGWLRGTYVVAGDATLRVRLSGRTTEGAEAHPAVLLPLPDTALLRWPKDDD